MSTGSGPNKEKSEPYKDSLLAAAFKGDAEKDMKAAAPSPGGGGGGTPDDEEENQNNSKSGPGL